jgi:hypothetical protein
LRRIDTKLKMHRRVKIGKNKSSKISHILNRDINYVIDLTFAKFSYTTLEKQKFGFKTEESGFTSSLV